MKEIYLAGGCFWGVEEYFSRIAGVVDTEVGYANGNRDNPTYELVCTGLSGFAEALKLVYDEDDVSLEYILEKFWEIIDPTSKNKQGNDRGSQYRSGIYFVDKEDEKVILESKEDESKKYQKPIVTEVKALENFYEAEPYHQDYLKKNPNGYCHIKF